MAMAIWTVRRGLSFSQSWLGWRFLDSWDYPHAVAAYRAGRQRGMD